MLTTWRKVDKNFLLSWRKGTEICSKNKIFSLNFDLNKCFCLFRVAILTFFIAAVAVFDQIVAAWQHSQIKSLLVFYPHCSRKNEYLNLNQIKRFWALSAKLAAAMGVEEERRFNFGHSADYSQPRPRAKKKFWNRHSLLYFGSGASSNFFLVLLLHKLEWWECTYWLPPLKDKSCK